MTGARAGGPAPGDALTTSVRSVAHRQVVGLLVLIALPFVIVGGILFAATGSCACSMQQPPPPSPVVGIVVAVDSAGLGKVNGFTIRIGADRSVGFVLGSLENATEFSPSHLAEHQASSEPIRVFYRLENGVGVVYRLEDALP